MPELTTPLVVANVALLALLPIAWLLYRSARKLRRRERAAWAQARTATAPPPELAASPAPEPVPPVVASPAPALATLADGPDVVRRAIRDTGAALPVTTEPTATGEAILLLVETVAADQPWIVTRFVHELTGTGFEVTLSANRETVLGRATSTVRVTQLNGDMPTSPCQTLVSTGRADAESTLSALLRALLQLGYRIRWTVDTEVMLATARGEVARVHLVPAPAIALPEASPERPTLTPTERPS
jgi:hypothetical protein